MTGGPLRETKPRPGEAGRVGDRSRREALLDEAALEINARGIAGAVLGHIASRVGLTRAALYYYFESREDLAFACYLRACERMAGDLEDAGREPDGLGRVLTTIHRMLDPERPPAVVLSEIPCLRGKYRLEVEGAHARNVETLRRFLADGVADGSVRACDTEIVAQTLFGMMSWVPLSEGWIEGSGDVLRLRSADALVRLAREGIAAEHHHLLDCPLDVSAFTPDPGNVFDPRESRAMKIEQLTRTASRLFNRQGIDGTSLDDVTAALGATKGAFYHYIAHKNELVVRCYRRAYDLYERFADAAEAAGRNGLERSYFGLHLNVQAQVAGLSPLAPLAGVDVLPKHVRAEMRRRSKDLENRFERFGREGIADRSLRPFDVQPVATFSAGAFGWIPKWLPEGDPRSPRHVADEIVALSAQGLGGR